MFQQEYWVVDTKYPDYVFSDPQPIISTNLIITVQEVPAQLCTEHADSNNLGFS